MTDWIIRSIPRDDYLEVSAKVIRASFADVARDFHLTESNCPTSPAFETAERLRHKRKGGLRLFGLFEDGVQTGFVALERANREIFYLERLAVVPGKRHQGRGAALVEFALREASSRGGTTVSIGTIAQNERLNAWYASLGFRERESKRIEGLPFEVSFMDIEVP